MEFKIQTFNNIASEGLNRFPEDHYKIDSDMDAPDAMLLRSFSLHNNNIPTSVIAIARAGVGVNNIPVEECTKAGVVVFNTPGANANAVKELVIAGLILSSRKI